MRPKSSDAAIDFQVTIVLAGTLIDEQGHTDVNRLRDLVTRTRERAQRDGKEARWNQPELDDIIRGATTERTRASYDTDLYLLADVGSLRFTVSPQGKPLGVADLLVQSGLVTYYRIIWRCQVHGPSGDPLAGLWDRVQELSLQLNQEARSLGLSPQLEGITLQERGSTGGSLAEFLSSASSLRPNLEVLFGSDVGSVRAASVYSDSLLMLVAGPTPDRYVVVSPPDGRELVVSTALYLLLAKRKLLSLRNGLNSAYEGTIQVRRKNVTEADLRTTLPHANNKAGDVQKRPSWLARVLPQGNRSQGYRDVRIELSRNKLDELLDARRLTEHAADRFLLLSHDVRVVTDFISFNLGEFLNPALHRPVLQKIPTVCQWEKEKLGDYREPLNTLVDSLLKEVEQTRRFIASISDVYSVYLNLDLQVRFERLYRLGAVIAVVGVVLTAVTIWH